MRLTYSSHIKKNAIMQGHEGLREDDLNFNRIATVYVVDSDPASAPLVQSVFKSRGYSIKSFSSIECLFNYNVPAPVSCLLMDYKVQGDIGMNGLQAQQEIGKRGWLLPTVFVSAHGSISAATEAMRNGAVDFLEKPLKSDRVQESVTTALKYAIKWYRQRKDCIQARQRLSSLSSRELEVLQLIISGWLNKQIAAELQITERTVKAHRVSIMQKCRVDSLALLVSMTLQAGLSRVEQFGDNK